MEGIPGSHAARIRKMMPLGLTAAVVAGSAASLWYLAAPSVTFHDSGEFALAAACGGIPHPPGAPTWTMCATAFVRILGFEDPARGTNLFSGLMGALTLGGLFLLVFVWVGHLHPCSPAWARATSGLTAAMVLFRAPAFLEQSTITEQYTLMTATLVLVLLMSTLLASHQLGPASGPRTRRGNRPALAVVVGLLWGLAVGNHLSQIGLAPMVGWALWAGMERPRRFPNAVRLAATCCLGFAGGLLSFLWVLVRSRANPVLDWGNIETIDRLIWAITRRQWPTRPLSDVPHRFVLEWLLSYDLFAQVGVIGLALAGLALLSLVKKRSIWLCALLGAVVPYTVGMLCAHLRQEGLDVSYIRQYGVSDWHLPVYLTFAACAGIGIAIVQSGPLLRSTRLGFAVSALVLLGLVSDVSASVRDTSLRNWSAPERFLDALLARLPPDAIVLTRTDNVSGMLSYHFLRSPGASQTRVAYDYYGTQRTIIDLLETGRMWSKAEKVRYLTETLVEPSQQPFRADPLSPADAAERPLYIEYSLSEGAAAGWLLPAGFLFEVMDSSVTDGDVRRAEARWREARPGDLVYPDQKAHRWEREAWLLLHQRRGGYFQARRMWPEAAESYRLALRWMPTSGETWFCLGFASEQAGDTLSALAAYRKAVNDAPSMAGPRVNLAILLAIAGEHQSAEALFEEELRLHPGSVPAATNLRVLRSRRRT